METISWILIVSIVVFILLGVWGIKFPRAGKDWNKSRSETMSMIFSMLIFLAMFLMLWYLMGVIEWPDAMDLIVWISAITFFVLIILAIVLPKGTRLRLGKKDNKIQAADDDD